MTFSYEIGHLLGGHHENDLSGGSYPRGYKFYTSSGYKRTIMHTASLNHIHEHISHFSNPNVNYPGTNTATGNSTNGDVVSQILSARSEVTNFRTSSFNLTIYINGPASAETGDNLQFGYNAYNMNGGAFDIDWHTSTDGINLSLMGGSSQFYTVMPSTNLWVKLHLTDWSGESDDHLCIVQNYHLSSPCTQCPDLYDAEVDTEEVIIYPTPSEDGKINLFFPNNVHSFEITLFSTEGKVLETRTSIEETDEAILDFSNYSSGVYLIKVATDEFVHTQRVQLEN